MKTKQSLKGKTRRKQLCVGIDEFYTAVLLACGPPIPHNVMQFFTVYVAYNRPLSGVSAWLKSPRGLQFTQCVTTFGEAKSRAAQLYLGYRVWYNKQRWEADKRDHRDDPN